jgi:hypothetical protein
MVDGFP